jgi:hypothetical protein
MAAHLTATGFTAWAQMGSNLSEPCDASATGGITF